MTMASGIYLVTHQDTWDASQLAVNTSSDTFKLSLVTDTHTPNYSTHDFYADITNEVTGTGWAAAQTLAGVTYVASGGFLTFDLTDVSVGTTTLSSVRGAIGWDDTLTNDPLIWGVTFGADYNTTAGTFAITWSANGAWRISTP